ncbi:MAG: hypothetical protein AAF704_09960 [Cyanobacteria bacterium P01_D01_bin.123]
MTSSLPTAPLPPSFKKAGLPSPPRPLTFCPSLRLPTAGSPALPSAPAPQRKVAASPMVPEQPFVGVIAQPVPIPPTLLEEVVDAPIAAALDPAFAPAATDSGLPPVAAVVASSVAAAASIPSERDESNNADASNSVDEVAPDASAAVSASSEQVETAAVAARALADVGDARSDSGAENQLAESDLSATVPVARTGAQDANAIERRTAEELEDWDLEEILGVAFAFLVLGSILYWLLGSHKVGFGAGKGLSPDLPRPELTAN